MTHPLIVHTPTFNMADLYSDLYSYNIVAVTPLLEAAVKHLLSEKQRDSISKDLLAELDEWNDSKLGIQLQSNVELESDGDKLMPFELVRKIQEQLQLTPQSNEAPLISDLMKGSRLVLPRYRPPPRNPELVARLEKIKADLENKEYNKMIGRAHDNTDRGVLQDLRIDVQATHRQLWMMLNFMFTVVGSFVFGYFAAYYAGFDLIWCYSMGLIFGLAVFFADVYFIAKNL